MFFGAPFYHELQFTCDTTFLNIKNTQQWVEKETEAAEDEQEVILRGREATMPTSMYQTLLIKQDGRPRRVGKIMFSGEVRI